MTPGIIHAAINGFAKFCAPLLEIPLRCSAALAGSLDETVAVWNTALSDDELKLLRPQAGAAAAAKGAANVFPRHHSYTGHSLGVVSVAVDPTGEFMSL